MIVGVLVASDDRPGSRPTPDAAIFLTGGDSEPTKGRAHNRLAQKQQGGTA
jgi:hypothetical protein